MKKLIVVSLAIVLAVVLATPFSRYGILGLVRGESFYKGKPTSYWRGVAKDNVLFLRQHMESRPVALTPTYFEQTQAFLGKLFTRGIEEPPDVKDPAALPVYIEMLDAEDADVRWFAAMMFHNSEPPAETAIPRLIPLLHDHNTHVRQAAILAIWSIEGEAAVPRLAHLLQDSDPEIRRWTVAMAIGSDESVNLVLPWLRDSEPIVRRRAANLLGDIGEPKKEVISALHEALDDPDEHVRGEAAQSLKTLLNDPDKEVREKAAGYLRDIEERKGNSTPKNR